MIIMNWLLRFMPVVAIECVYTLLQCSSAISELWLLRLMPVAGCA